MAATATAAAVEESPLLDDLDEPRRPRRRRLLLLAALLLVSAAASWWFVLRGDPGEAAAPEPVEGAVVEVAQMTVNLAGPELHYARFSFAVVLAEGVAPADVEGRFPLLKDAALDTVQRFTQDRLRTPEGTEQFRQELGARARALYADGQVLRVVLTELVVQ